MHQSRAIGWIVAAVVAGATAIAAADDLANWQHDIRDPQQQQWEQNVGKAPMLDEKHPSRTLDQAESLSLENGNIVLRTSIPTTPNSGDAEHGQYVRVQIAGWPAWANLRITGSKTDGKQAVVPQSFELSLTTFAADHIQMLAVNKLSDQISMATVRSDPAGTVDVNLSEEDKDDDFTRPHSCMLMIFTIRHPFAPPPIVYRGADFAALLQKNPDVVRHYLRPVFHRLDADSLLAAEAAVAWQVFPDGWRSDPTIAAAVNKLVPTLAGGTFRQRADARRSLEALGLPGALEILHLDRSKLTPEQNTQLDRVVAPLRQLSAEQVKQLRTDPLFLIDCLYCNDLAIRKAAIDQLRMRIPLGEDLVYDPAADATARNAAIEMIYGKLVQWKQIAAE